MSHRTWSAPASLVPWLAGLAASTDEGAPPTVRVLPDGGVDLLLSAPVAGGPWTAEVFGAKRCALVVRDARPMRKLAVRLRPGAAMRWLGVPSHALVDRVLPLDDVLGASSRELVAGVEEAHDDRERLGQLIAGLEGHARRLAPPPALVEAAVTLTSRTGGRVSTRALARRLDVSERRLERAFREHVGLGPKRLARIVRLGAARQALAHGVSQLEAALAAGYHDQAHLHRDAHALAGVAPSAL